MMEKWKWIVKGFLLEIVLVSMPLLAETNLDSGTLTVKEYKSHTPRISSSLTERGFKIVVENVKLDDVLEFTLNGEIVTEAIDTLLDDEGKKLIDIKKNDNDNGFILDITMEPESLAGAKFGLILKDGLKIRKTIYPGGEVNKSDSRWLGTALKVATVVSAVVDVYQGLKETDKPEAADTCSPTSTRVDRPPLPQSELAVDHRIATSTDRMLIKGYVEKFDPSTCGWWATYDHCKEVLRNQEVKIYGKSEGFWTLITTTRTDQNGFYLLQIKDYCGPLAVATTVNGVEAWEERQLYSRCSPDINEQYVILRMK